MAEISDKVSEFEVYEFTKIRAKSAESNAEIPSGTNALFAKISAFSICQ